MLLEAEIIDFVFYVLAHPYIYIYMHIHACETTYMPLITVNVNCYQFKIGEEHRANSIYINSIKVLRNATHLK